MYESIIEGINDPGIFKAIFTAGGPGSGKSTAAKDLGLFALGLRGINSDTAFEHALKKNNLPLKLSSLDPEVIDTMRVKAKTLAGKQMDLALKGRLGLVIDSTARNVERILKQKKMLEEMGYETAMVFVDTKLETALERNAKRARSVPEKIVINSHEEIAKNANRLEKIFGKRKFFRVPNDGDLGDLRKNTNRIFPKVSAFVKSTPMNKQSKEWMAQFEAMNEAKLDMKKNMKLVDTFGKTVASLAKTKYDPNDPEGSINTAFGKLRTGTWSPKQWENIHKMAAGLRSLGFKLPALKGMYMGLDKNSNAKFFEEIEAMFEADTRTPAARNKSKTIANLAAFEKKLLKKMMGNPGKAIMELKVAIDTFKKLIGKSLPMLQPLFQAELDKMEGMLSQLSGLKESFAGPIPIYEEKISKSTLKKIAKMDDKALMLARKNVKAILSFTDPAQAPELFKAINKEMNRRIMAEAGEVVGAVAGKATNTASIPSGPGSVTPDSTFSGNAVFKCDNETFANCIKGKKKYGRWSAYLGKDNPYFAHVQNWMKQSYKHKNFMLQNKQTGELVFARNPLGEGTINELFDNLPLSKKEMNAFGMAAKKWKGIRAIGSPQVTSNQLTQNFQTTEGLKRTSFTVTMSKQKDPFKLGAKFYDIRHAENKSSSQATQSSKFIKEEDIGLLKSELKRFSLMLNRRYVIR